MHQFLFLDSDIWLRGLLIMVLVTALGCLAAILATMGPLRRVMENKPPVAPFFGGITALFALLLAFAVADAWSRDIQASSNLGLERRALFFLLKGAEVLPDREMGSLAQRYLSASLEGEWRVNSNETPSEGVEQVLRAIEEHALRGLLRANGSGPSSFRQHLMQWVEDLRAARDVRLRLGADYGQGWKWATLLGLCFLSQISIALVHLDRRRTAFVCVIVFGLAATSALTVLAGFEGAYDGIGAVRPHSLEALLDP
ncbi:bestrophin-like domain [Roseicella aquatilis]|uniref:DUF4239 domain-containing protein n=1 Tax=Roseicella aquatilis TaxID=2527868 RepID=A0A4R4D2U3_9PROT|nr:hypothetical protein [Roseicella aquatilis]TCZ53186.1 hypothetical protein EXY23_25130 [Roseicella aquatilis]